MMDAELKGYLDLKFALVHALITKEADEIDAALDELEENVEGEQADKWVDGISPRGVPMTSDEADDAVDFHDILVRVERKSRRAPNGDIIRGFRFFKKGLFGLSMFWRRRIRAADRT